MKKPEKLYEGNMRKKYLLFAVPLILSALLSQSYNFVNSIMIGKFIGSEAFAATAVTTELVELLNSIFFGYLTGIGIYVSVLFGKNEYEKMLNIIKLNFLLSSILAIIIALVCNIFCNQIFDILNVNEQVYKNAEMYFRTYVLGYIVFQFNWGFTYISNGMSLTKLPLTASVITGIINVCLNYLFLSVLHKGIGYSALSTVISSFATTVVYFFIYIKLFKNLGLKLKGLKINKELFKDSVGYGAPSMFQQMTMYACTALVSPLTNTCATAAISGYAVANKARSLILAIYQNSGKANTTFVAQAMGAGKIDKIKKGISIGTTQGLIFFVVTLSLFMIFAKQFTALFLDPAADAESFTVSVNIIRFLFPFLIFNVFNNLFHGIFRAVGSGMLMFTSTLIYAVSYVIYAYILFAVLPYEIRIYGVHIALSGAYITELIFATYLFVTGKWKSQEYLLLEHAGQSK
ncbi:MAG: MATE family efflux transporter [Clostridia bacterium]|nr:MATE family efflux transporter [Clostridia bacterium]